MSHFHASKVENYGEKQYIYIGITGTTIIILLCIYFFYNKKQKDKYKLLKDVGLNRPNFRNIISDSYYDLDRNLSRKIRQDQDNLSLKYNNNRYNRFRSRNNQK